MTGHVREVEMDQQSKQDFWMKKNIKGSTEKAEHRDVIPLNQVEGIKDVEGL